MTEAELMGRRKTSVYNCAHFAADVWERETGDDIRGLLCGLLVPRAQRLASLRLRNDFVRMDRPASLSLVMFHRLHAEPHCGVYVRNLVAHLTELGAVRQPMHTAKLGYTCVRFYAPR